jgi:hypothetical protein
MQHWSLVVYGLAALWAVQALLNLMLVQRRCQLVALQKKELARRQATVQAKEEQTERLPGLKEPPAPVTRKAA